MRPNEILEKENLCIEENAPFCMAECPLHFDVRNMIALIKKGDYRNAYAQYKKAALFPGIVSLSCDAPCEKKCKRNEVGGSIRIKELEQFISKHGKHSTEAPSSSIAMSKRVALVGDMLDSMAVIYLLLGKGYSPDLFISTQSLSIEGDDFDFINDERVTKYTDQIIDRSFILKLTEDYDAVYLSKFSKEGFSSVCKDTPEITGCFFSIDTESVIEKISHGKQIAITIDRFLKGVSLTAGRKNEGSYETLLYTSVSGITKKAPVSKAYDAFTDDEAKLEAERCIDCRCLECVKQCKFMEKYDKYPRKYIREVFNNITTIAVAGGMGFRKSTPAINSCTLCGLCGEICPNSVPMAEITRSAREVLVSGKVMPPRYHDFPLRDMLYSNSDKVSFFRNPTGKSNSGYMFFPGCQLIAAYPESIKPAYDFLSGVLGGNVGMMLGCCGTPAMWAGEKIVYEEVMGRFKDIWRDAGKPTIITACPTCNREFSEAIPEVKTKTLWHYYSVFNLPDKSDQSEPEVINVSIHDPCTSRYCPDMHDEIRTILVKSGYRIEEYEYSKNMTRCCGFGGLISYGDASLAKEFSDKRLSETKNAIVTYCSVCRDVFANSKKPVYHIFDIINRKATRERGLREKIGISEKTKIRAELKKMLLKEIWGEEYTDSGNEYDQVSLVIGSEARQKLEDRLILEDNIKEVIYEAERTGGRIVNPGTGNSTASKKIGIVTYWVEYKKIGELFHVHSAYSHRIRIVEGEMVFVGGGQIQQIQIKGGSE